ncbi:MAG: amidohydrolase [Xanthomonadales bacterium]|nr:amidohydrolase [Xanthomonadales bacterium]
MACVDLWGGSSADLILLNGKIVTVNSAFDVEEAIAIRGDSILAVGSDEEIARRQGPETRVLDLGGRTVIPGLIDGHYHLLEKAVNFQFGVDVALADSIEEMVRRIQERIATTPPGQWIYTTSGWLPQQLKEGRMPTRDDLDPVSPDHPVIVMGGHSVYLNSQALKLAGITRETVSPDGGTIVKDPDTGEPTGQLIENAMYLAPKRSEFGAVSPQQKLDALRGAQKILNAAGITSVREPGLAAEDMRLYQQLHDDGELSLRVSMGYSLDPSKDTAELVAELQTWGVSTGFGNTWLRLDGIGEFGIDGGFEAGLMSEPYRHAPGDLQPENYFGMQRISTEKIERTTAAMSELGWRATFHVVGDAALDVALDAYEKADKANAIAAKRWVVEHAHYTRPDQFARIKSLGLVISTQFHPYMSAQNMIHFWGEERAAQTMRLRDWLDAGLIVGGGSDWSLMPANPFWILYFWISRDTRLGGFVGLDQRISREEALRVMTINNAYITFEEKLKGSLEAGKLADLLVLSDDYLTVPEAEVRDIEPLLTVVGGRVVFQSAPGLFETP